MTHAAERYVLVTDIKIILAAVVARVVLAGVVAGLASGAYSAWDYYARTGNWHGAIRCGMTMGGYAFTVTLFSPYVSGTYAAYYTSATILAGIPIAYWRCGG
jgi:hypothetical protein